MVFDHARLNWKKSNLQTVLKKIHNEPQSMGRTLWRHHMLSRCNMTCMIGKYFNHCFILSFLSCHCKFHFTLNSSCIIYWPNRLFPWLLPPGFHLGDCTSQAAAIPKVSCVKIFDVIKVIFILLSFVVLCSIVLHYFSCDLLHRIWRALACVLHCVVCVYKKKAIKKQSIKNL